MRLDVVGGPADGAHAARGRDVFRWIDADGRGSRDARQGCGLYWRCRDRWEFTGEECWPCDCGGVVVERTDRCPLCGREREGLVADESQNGAERRPTERVILKHEWVIVVPEDLSAEQLEKIGQILGARRKPAMLEGWVEVARNTGPTKRACIIAYAGEPGTADAKVGTFRAPSLTAWKDALSFEAPPKPLVQMRVVD